MGADGKAHGTSMCSSSTVADTLPIHRVSVDGFWMDATEVTSAQFGKFVEATGYKTVAEIAPTKEQFPDAPPENLVAGSVVFAKTPAPVSLNDHSQWWTSFPAPTGGIPRGLRATSRAARIFPSCKSLTRTP